MGELAWTIRNTVTCWWYRLTYCRRHGHLHKMGMPDYCANCGKPRKPATEAM